MNSFIEKAMGTAYTENGALSNGTMGSHLLDQFGKAGTARNRSIDIVFDEQSQLWDENPELALRFPFYLRMVTRKSKFNSEKETDTVQRGQGARDESFKRLIWIALNHPDEFYRNLWILPIVGSWKDLWVLMTMEDRLDREKFYEVIASGIVDDYHRDLVKKYMPQIRAVSKCKTDWTRKTTKFAKEFCKSAGWSAEDYRKFKSTGKAHEFQRLMASKMFDKINWNTIPGKALLKISSSKFLKAHNLEESYVDWIKKQPVAKFNGYPYELGKVYRNEVGGWYCGQGKLSPAVKYTLDKQFEGLIKTGKENGGAIKGNVWCALDTSGSMASTIPGTDVTALDVCKSLGVYFSTLNEGAFHKNVIMFDDTSKVKQLKGSFTDMMEQIPNDAMGSTNFQSVIDEIVRIRKHNPNIPLSDYPETLLVVSDMQFNPTGRYYYWDEDKDYTSKDEQTNYQNAINKLRSVFPSEFVDNFKIVWWYCTSRITSDFPSTMEDGGTYMISGFDGSVISLLLGGDAYVDLETGKKVQPTMKELVEKALNQEILQFVR